MLTFSRAAVLSLALWLVWIVLLSPSLSLFKKAVVVLLTILVAFGLSQIWSSEMASRLTLTEDPRLDTSMAGLRAFSDSPIWGHGFSHVWPWWQRHGELGAGLLTSRREGLLAFTPYGWVLWNPHSLVALVGAETGILGAALVLLLFGLPLIRARRGKKTDLFTALFIVVTLDALLGGSFYAFPELSSIWWMYVVSLGVEGPLRAASRRRRLEPVASTRRIRFPSRSVL
jgi:O-antigen ligase